MRHAGGRPSKLTPERRDRFIDAIRAGNYVEVAASLSGIGTSTVYRWLARGREAKGGEYREFWEASREAEAFAEDSALKLVRRAALTDPRQWRAAMTFLERRFRDRWGGGPAPDTADGAMDDFLPTTANVTDEPIVVPIADRLTGILDALAAAGKLPPPTDPADRA